MTDDMVRTPKFTIRRLGQAPPAPEPPPERPTPPIRRRSRAERPSDPTTGPIGTAPEAVVHDAPGARSDTPGPAASTQAASSAEQTAGLFVSARAALAFLGSAFNLRPDFHQANVRRAPSGAWWAELQAEPGALIELVWAAGGRPYTKRDGRWGVASPLVRAPSGGRLRPDTWPVLELGDLLARVQLSEGSYEPAGQIDLILPGRLAGLALKRATALGLQASMAPLSLRPLAGSQGDAAGAILMQLRAPGRGSIPRSLVHALGDLPFCAVCTSFRFHEPAGQLFLDVRCRLPLPVSLVQGMVPPNSAWLLAPADIGHRQFQLPGEVTDCASLLQIPDRVLATMPATPPAQLARPIAVSIVRNPGRNRRVDAVMVDDRELDWLRRYLMTRPIGEEGYLLPGPGRHLVTSPGGLVDALPLGIPLAWAGPHSFFVETGTDFHPPVPSRARERCFGLGPETVVVALTEGAYRFDPEQAIPLWSLWVGPPPSVEARVSDNGREIVNRVADLLRKVGERVQGAGRPRRPILGLFRGRPEVSRLLSDAEKAERRGELIRAAELYEKAGQHGPAGRLYERAARDLDG